MQFTLECKAEISKPGILYVERDIYQADRKNIFIIFVDVSSSSDPYFKSGLYGLREFSRLMYVAIK
jgi:hypothetical protein